MKNYIHAFAEITKCTALSLFACVAWSCSGDDELETMLAAETTPVTFCVDSYDHPILFDFTDGWRYIGSDTVKDAKTVKTTVNMHQGKHNIVIVKGVCYEYPDTEPSKYEGLHFNPETKNFYLNSSTNGIAWRSIGNEEHSVAANNNVYYWHRQLEVSPYLLPEQTPDYTPVTATLNIIQTDVIKPSDIVNVGDYLRTDVSDLPFVVEVGMSDNSYKTREKTYTLHYYLGTMKSTSQLQINSRYITLCPKDGLSVGQLAMTLRAKGDDEYRALYSVMLPEFTLQRGYITILRGPLFSGSTSDWTVEMKPYADTHPWF